MKQLQKENGSLVLLSQRLRQSVQTLESQINFHIRSGCQVPIQQNDEVLEIEKHLREEICKSMKDLSKNVYRYKI